MSESAVIRAPSRLERLPLEIIETIFFYCLDFNLPQASIYLNRALSTPIIYTWLVRLACSSSNPGTKQGFFTSDYLPPQVDFFAFSDAQRAHLQSAIFKCEWLTLPLIRKCQKQHIEHCIRRKCEGLEFSAEDKEKLARLTIGAQDPYMPQNTKRSSVLEFRPQITAPLPGSSSSSESQVLIWPQTASFQVRIRGHIPDIFQLPACGHIPARIPDRLLQAPWTETKLDLLRLLAEYAYIDEDDEHSRADQVLRRVIRNRDFSTFWSLMNISVRTKVSKYLKPWPVFPAHFRLVLKYGDKENDPFIEYLVKERWDDIPGRDPRLKPALMARARKG